eukprot:10038497-Alexandrium_andersonii.AAC.1
MLHAVYCAAHMCSPNVVDACCVLGASALIPQSRAKACVRACVRECVRGARVRACVPTCARLARRPAARQSDCSGGREGCRAGGRLPPLPRRH